MAILHVKYFFVYSAERRAFRWGKSCANCRTPGDGFGNRCRRIGLLLQEKG